MKVPGTKLVFTGAIGAFLIIASCARTNQVSSVVYVRPPFQSVQVAPNVYQVDPAKGGDIRIANGTHIHIPANAFVDATGKPITEMVDIQYREYHTTADIMASGIPMNYDSAGQKLNFESAGMFDINGSCKNEPVKLADGKKIEVQMASYTAGSKFNFYGYDSKTNSWTCKGSVTPAPNAEKQQAMAKLDQEQSKITPPKKADPNKMVMDLQVNYNLYPELKAFDGVLWQYAGADPKKGPEHLGKKFAANNWSNIQVKPNPDQDHTYILAVDCGKEHLSMVVEPVLMGKDLEKARAKFTKEMSNYVKIESAMIDERKRVQKEADILRTFEVSNFGIYNWDCVLRQAGVVPAPASFTFDQKVDEDKLTIYLISGEAHRLVTYYPGDRKNFSFDPNLRNCLVAVMPNDRLAIFSSDEFKKIKSWRNGDPIKFALKTMDKKIKDVSDLNQVLENI